MRSVLFALCSYGVSDCLCAKAWLAHVSSMSENSVLFIWDGTHKTQRELAFVAVFLSDLSIFCFCSFLFFRLRWFLLLLLLLLTLLCPLLLLVGESLSRSDSTYICKCLPIKGSGADTRSDLDNCNDRLSSWYSAQEFGMTAFAKLILLLAG